MLPLVAGVFGGLVQSLSGASADEGNVAVRVDEHMVKESLVELAAHVRWLVTVGAGRVGEHGHGTVVEVHDGGVVTLGGHEQELGVALLAPDAVLLDLEQVEWYGVGQVGT